LVENKIRVLILADSTAMWIRPNRNHNNQLVYVEHLRKKNIAVDIIATPGMTSKDVMNIYWNELGAKFYDIYIVSVGINDLTPRSYPRWMWRLHNSIVLPLAWHEKLYESFYKLFTNRYIQKLFSKYGVSKPWISQQNFKQYLGKFQELVLKESDAKIIYCSLPMVSKRVSSLLYGIDKNIIDYKKEINILSKEDRVFEIDVDKLFESDRERYNIEGIHYTVDGHYKVFEEIQRILEENR